MTGMVMDCCCNAGERERGRKRRRMLWKLQPATCSSPSYEQTNYSFRPHVATDLVPTIDPQYDGIDNLGNLTLCGEHLPRLSPIDRMTLN